MLRGAIWDLDGTILDSMSAWDHVGENYLRSQGIEPEPDLDEAIATMSLHQAADYFIEHYGVKQTRVPASSITLSCVIPPMAITGIFTASHICFIVSWLILPASFLVPVWNAAPTPR